MNDEFSDSTVLIAIFFAVVIVFILAFSTRPNQRQVNPSIQWRESQEEGSSELLRINDLPSNTKQSII